MSSEVTGVVVSDYRKGVSIDDAGDDLSGREREVLQLIAEGYSTANIAARLTLSVKTIESHRKRIMDKLGLRSVAELTKYAIRNGLTGTGE